MLESCWQTTKKFAYTDGAPIKIYPVLRTEELIGERVKKIYGWIILNIVSDVQYLAIWSLLDHTLKRWWGGGVKGRKAQS